MRESKYRNRDRTSVCLFEEGGGGGRGEIENFEVY